MTPGKRVKYVQYVGMKVGISTRDMDVKQSEKNSNTSALLMNSENRKTKNECYRQGDNMQMQIPQRNRKPRLKWTKELHQHFVHAVNQLGGAYDATPKNIVKLMGFQQITSNHVKSHLQKYRHSKEFCKIASIRSAENGITVMPYEANQENMHSKTLAWHTHKDTQMCKTQKLLIEGQRNFQTESERSETFQQQVQCSQGKNLIAVLEKIPEATKGLDKNSAEVKSKKDKLYEPVIYQTRTHSLYSCLTFCKVTEKDQETRKVGAKADSGMQLALNDIKKKNKLEAENTMWLAAVKKDRSLHSSHTDIDGNVEEAEHRQKLANDCTISVGLQVTKANTSSRFLEGGTKTRAEDSDNLCDLDTFSVQVEPMGVPIKSKLTSFTGNGPLHSSRESNLNYHLFDLNTSVLDEP